MCQGIAIFANNKRVVYGKKTNSHSTTAKQLRINEDKYRHYEYLWWEKDLQEVHMDRIAEDILKGIDKKIAYGLASQLVKDNFTTQTGLAKWLKGVPDEWDKLLDPKFKTLAKKVNPALVLYQDRIKRFKKTKIEKYNPYQATKLPTLKQLKSFKKLAQVGDQVGDQVRDQVGDQVGAQVGDQVGDQVWDQVRAQVWAQVRAQVRAQVGDQVRDQVRDQVWAQVRAQVWAQVRAQQYATSYWAIKVILGLPIKHWFFDFLKLGVMVVFVKGKVKVFGKKGKFLGEYNEEDLI